MNRRQALLTLGGGLAAPRISFAAPAAGPESPNHLPFLMHQDFAELYVAAWRVEEGRRDAANPLLEPAMPWDAGGVFAHGTVLRDPIDGLWKAWQVSTPVVPMENLEKPGHDRRLTYLESPDGVHWTRPKLPFVKWPGHSATNILLDFDSGGQATYASVNIDPRRDPPYEMFVFREPRYKNPSGKVGPLAAPRSARGSYRYRSRDGKDWKAVEGPLQIAPSDVCYIHRRPDASYIAYMKTPVPAYPGGLSPFDNNAGLVRLTGFRTSPDGTKWGEIKTVLGPDWRDPADLQFMELCPHPAAGGQVAFLTMYHSLTQLIDIQVAGSRDGVNWWRPERRPALANSPLGDYGGGMIWQMKEPVREGDKLHVYYGAMEGIHSDIYNTRETGRPLPTAGGGTIKPQPIGTLCFNGALCRATWTIDRLWALVCAAGGMNVGEATTRPKALAGRRLLVNALTRPGGSLRVELLDSSGKPLKGFTREDSQPFRGDEHSAVLTWKGGDKAPEGAVQARFCVQRAFLYGFDWRA